MNYHGTNYWTQADDWQLQTVSLAPYAGQQISLKFELSSGSYYLDGGVWLDDLTISDAEWYAWKPFREDTTLASRRFSAVSTNIDDCADFSVFEVTSEQSSHSGDWMVTNNVEGAADCFYKAGPDFSTLSENNPFLYRLTSKSTFTPPENSRLLIRAMYKLVYSEPVETFRIKVSSNGTDYTTLWSTSEYIGTWNTINLDMADYVGQPIYLQFEYEGNNGNPYFTNGIGGVWIDSIDLEGTVNADLEGQPIYYTMLSDLPAGTHTLAASLFDTNGVEHAISPSFTLSVSGEVDDGDGMPSAWELEHGLDPDVNDGALDPDGDLLSNFDEYVAGTDPKNAESRWIIQPGDAGLPTFYGAQDRLYTIEYSTNLVTGPWATLVSGLEGSDALIDVESYDSPTNSVRFYRVGVQVQ